jgi:hypothetical protein
MREVISQLSSDKQARINALLANSAYLESDEGVKSRADQIREMEENFNEIVSGITNPQPEVDLSENPFFAAGQRGMERLKWEYAPPPEQPQG